MSGITGEIRTHAKLLNQATAANSLSLSQLSSLVQQFAKSSDFIQTGLPGPVVNTNQN